MHPKLVSFDGESHGMWFCCKVKTHAILNKTVAVLKAMIKTLAGLHFNTDEQQLAENSSGSLDSASRCLRLLGESERVLVGP